MSGTEPQNLFSYCKVCKINHMQKRKHIFSKKHKVKLKHILKKFGAKIKLCKPYVENPLIQEGEFEPGMNFWCYFCEKECEKHVSDREKTIINGGLIEHIACDEHYKMTQTFWLVNGVEEKFKINFILSKTDLNVFKDKLELLVNKYEHKAEERTKKISEEIKQSENDCLFKSFVQCSGAGSSSLSSIRTIFRTVRNQRNILQNPTGYHNGVRVWRGGIVKYKQGSDQIISAKFQQKTNTTYKKSIKTSNTIYTVSTESDGLTAVNIKYDNKRGNIHTGATPPWLRNDDDPEHTNNQVTAGPSEEEFRQHQKRVEKSKLNPNRVGANFDHTAVTSHSNWLPSFGRVWNDEARWKSRKQYRSEVERTSSVHQAKKKKR